MMGHENVLKYFLSHPSLKQSDMFQKDNDGQNMLHKACKSGHFNTTKLIIEMGGSALKNDADNHGKFPFDLISDNEAKIKFSML